MSYGRDATQFVPEPMILTNVVCLHITGRERERDGSMSEDTVVFKRTEANRLRTHVWSKKKKLKLKKLKIVNKEMIT